MSVHLPPPLRLPNTAVLLVLLPSMAAGEMSPGVSLTQAISHLQGRLGTAIRVLPVDEAHHPAVVRSFGPPALPACVLVRQGVELWRQQGIPQDDGFVATLLAVADGSQGRTFLR